MALVLAIEPDLRQAAILKRIVKEKVRAQLVLVDTRDAAISAIDAQIPDVILVTALLSPRDEEELVAHLKTLAGAEHLQTHTIPQLASGRLAADDEGGGLFGKFRRKKESAPMPGCDPNLFADEIGTFLDRASQLKAESLAALHHRVAELESRRAQAPQAQSPAAPPAAEPAPPDTAAAAGTSPAAASPSSSWASPFEWRRESAPPAAKEKKKPAEPARPPAKPLVANVPLAVIADEEQRRAEEDAEHQRLEAEAARRREEEAARAAREETERARKEAEVRAARERQEREEAERKRKDEEARLERERQERERLEREAAERKRKEAEARAARERKEREEAERKHKEAAAKAARERQEREEAERRRLEALAKAERERREREEAERRRLEAEARAERERREREEAERRRLEAEAAAERAERERIEAEAAERERIAAAERAAREKAEAEAAARARQARKRVAAAVKQFGGPPAPPALSSAPEGDDHYAEFRDGYDESRSGVLRLAPLAMWARAERPAAPTEGPSRDDFQEIMSRLAMPPQVAGVHYPRGCRIRRVRVPASGAAPKKYAKPLIVSRKALDERNAGR